jgi:uncharacterized protein
MDDNAAQEHPIVPRRLKFDLSRRIPKRWNADCAAKTYFFDALGMVVPGFERMGIVSILFFREQLQGQPVYSQVKGFIGQEASHSAVYINYNKVLESHGYEVSRMEKGNIRFLYLMGKICPKKFLLANTLAVEHLTAVWSHCVLSDPFWFEHADPTFTAIWRWHAIEEIEHKSVAFDVFRAVNGGYFTRVLGMLSATLSLTFFMTRNMWHMMGKDKCRWDIKLWWKMLNTYWGKGGFLRQAIKPYLAYYKPSFHPWQQNDLHLIEKWKAYLDTTNESLDEMAKRLELSQPAA